MTVTYEDGTATLKVGDPDYTPDDARLSCRQVKPAGGGEGFYTCTRVTGHVANHAAAGGVYIMAVWDEGDEFADDSTDFELAQRMISDSLAYFMARRDPLPEV